MSEPTTPTRDDRLALKTPVGITGIGAIATIVAAVAGLREVAPGHDIPVRAPLAERGVGLPLGPKGAAVSAAVDTATVVVPDPAPATLFALWAQPIWPALAVLAGLGLAAAFLILVARGQVFARRSSRPAATAAAVVGVGWAGTTVLTNMTTNGALAAISNRTYDSVTFTVSMVPFLATLLLGGLATALKMGERLQRDTDGLL